MKYSPLIDVCTSVVIIEQRSGCKSVTQRMEDCVLCSYVLKGDDVLTITFGQVDALVAHISVDGCPDELLDCPHLTSRLMGR
jgi:uncharacterized Fe-S cluster-containing MiaB family protein